METRNHSVRGLGVAGSFLNKKVLTRVCIPLLIVLLIGNHAYKSFFPKVHVQGFTIHDGDILVLQNKWTGEIDIYGANIDPSRLDYIHLENMFQPLKSNDEAMKEFEESMQAILNARTEEEIKQRFNSERISSSDRTVKEIDERWKILQVAKELEDVRFYKRGNIKNNGRQY